MIPAEAWPKGDLIEWADDDTRTFHDFFNETQRPYTAEENAEADARDAEVQRLATLLRLRQQLGAGVASITKARDAASNDVGVANGLRVQAVAARAATLTQRDTVAAFVPSATYSAAQLVAVRNAVTDVLDRLVQTQQALADFYAYRAANDANAVTTAESLLWVARLVSGQLED